MLKNKPIFVLYGLSTFQKWVCCNKPTLFYGGANMTDTAKKDVREKKNVPISALIPADTDKVLREIAERQGNGYGVVIRAACKEYADKHGKI